MNEHDLKRPRVGVGISISCRQDLEASYDEKHIFMATR